MERAKAINPRSRNWCFTINNYTDEDEEALRAVDFRYMVYGRERGENGTAHLQGFVCFSNPRYFNGVKNWPAFKKAHLEITKGTVKQAADYCKKDGQYVELGELPASQADKGAMEKGRWETALAQAKEAGEVDDAHIAFVHARTVQFLHSQETMKRVRLDTEIKHQWFFGASGTGKSRTARENWPGAYLKMCNKWWDGYAEEDVVLIEDFDKSHHVLGHHLKIWADRYPFLSEKKGTSMKIRPQMIVVTSNWHPNEIWSDETTLEPIMRRFEVTEFKREE